MRVRGQSCSSLHRRRPCANLWNKISNPVGTQQQNPTARAGLHFILHFPNTGVNNVGICSCSISVLFPDRTRTGSITLSGSAPAGVNRRAMRSRFFATCGNTRMVSKRRRFHRMASPIITSPSRASAPASRARPPAKMTTCHQQSAGSACSSWTARASQNRTTWVLGNFMPTVTLAARRPSSGPARRDKPISH